MRWLRGVYSVWFVGWAAAYLSYFGPAAFLWVCCLSNVVVLAGFWLERPAFFSAAAVAVLGVQAVWWFDLLGRALLGTFPLGVTAYLFDPATPLLIRALSGFHGWMPALLVFLVARSGYQPAAMPWVVLGSVALFILCSFASPPPLPGAMASRTPNINWVHGIAGADSHKGAAFDVLRALTVYLAIFVLPTHVALRYLAPRARTPRAELAGGI